MEEKTGSARKRALDVAYAMIKAAPSWERLEFQAGYFEGLVAGYHHAGLLGQEEVVRLREQMRAALPVRPAWWDLASRWRF